MHQSSRRVLRALELDETSKLIDTSDFAPKYLSLFNFFLFYVLVFDFGLSIVIFLIGSGS